MQIDEIEIKHDDCGNKVFIDSRAKDLIKQAILEGLPEKHT